MILKQNHNTPNASLFALTAIFAFVLSTGCAKQGQFPITSIDDSNQSSGATPDTGTDEGTTETPAETTPPAPIENSYKMQALAWETESKPERKQWSEHLQKIILNEWSSLLPGADDITSFCPRYNQLDNNERANAWAQIFVAIAKFESAYSPVSRMQETTMGSDPVTRKPVYSEGLLQLSYQDIQWAPWCKFDWNKDKNLSPTDPKKTILDPYLNLDCGVGIMALQIKNKGRIVVSSGVYWAVIKSGGRYQQISSIQSMVKALPLCK
ncbi:hypothetical protein [Bdellovibrio reynosensis]|uniref:Transglycosylase SLT domain-containing protein n=1 Tax=Bdellovibrio reynosensis TaxID=2835041 RepID=A0ABY4CBZ7_9BACT|nr:hypothetical protein [Bdellovibrio reynosensis]UOF02496.1 hypothetical protein MNR06_05970 [Bdellovibrio reynosensis]